MYDNHTDMVGLAADWEKIFSYDEFGDSSAGSYEIRSHFFIFRISYFYCLYYSIDYFSLLFS